MVTEHSRHNTTRLLGADNKALKEKLSLNWTGHFKFIAISPSPAHNQPDGSSIEDKLLYLDLPSNMFGPAVKPRVSVVRCKSCANPYDADDMPGNLPAGLTHYVLHAFATKSPPSHITIDDILTPPILLGVAKITGHQCVRGRGGTIAVLYETRRDGLLRPTWERELDLQPFGHHILTYCAAGPTRHRLPIRQHQQLCINAVALEIAAPKGNATCRVPTDLSRTMFTVPALCPTPYPLEPLSGTIPLTVPGGPARLSNHPMTPP